MDLTEFNKNRLVEIQTLVSLITLCASLLVVYKDDKDTKNFYEYIIKLSNIRIAELLNGDNKLLMKYKEMFEDKFKGNFRSKLDELEDQLGNI